ncbi:MAG: hypothetical protein MJE77_10155 [Proteobacteria bacterium]|nr:hypothetical protein [Pseudomonadota bacterium]
MKRVLHLVRTDLPDWVVGSRDRVVYVEMAAPAGVAADCIWSLEPSRDQEPFLSSAELVELVFAYDAVAVW